MFSRKTVVDVLLAVFWLGALANAVVLPPSTGSSSALPTSSLGFSSDQVNAQTQVISSTLPSLSTTVPDTIKSHHLHHSNKHTGTHRGAEASHKPRHQERHILRPHGHAKQATTLNGLIIDGGPSPTAGARSSVVFADTETLGHSYVQPTPSPQPDSSLPNFLLSQFTTTCVAVGKLHAGSQIDFQRAIGEQCTYLASTSAGDFNATYNAYNNYTRLSSGVWVQFEINFRAASATDNVKLGASLCSGIFEKVVLTCPTNAHGMTSGGMTSNDNMTFFILTNTVADSGPMARSLDKAIYAGAAGADLSEVDQKLQAAHESQGDDHRKSQQGFHEMQERSLAVLKIRETGAQSDMPQPSPTSAPVTSNLASAPDTQITAVTMLAPCGQACYEGMINIATTQLGCQEGDAFCYCKQADFAYGIVDCAHQACRKPSDAMAVIHWATRMCDNVAEQISLSVAAHRTGTGLMQATAMAANSTWAASATPTMTSLFGGR